MVDLESGTAKVGVRMSLDFSAFSRVLEVGASEEGDLDDAGGSGGGTVDELGRVFVGGPRVGV